VTQKWTTLELKASEKVSGLIGKLHYYQRWQPMDLADIVNNLIEISRKKHFENSRHRCSSEGDGD
jgi:hypothetical protein